MNYIHKLKFATKAQTDSIITDEIKAISMTIVEVGTIIKPAIVDEEGNEVTPETQVEGWHVDILSEKSIDELRAYCLDHAPAQPAHGYDWASRPAVLVLKVGEVEI